LTQLEQINIVTGFGGGILSNQVGVGFLQGVVMPCGGGLRHLFDHDGARKNPRSVLAGR